MSIRDDARQEAERRWPSYPAVGFSGANDRQQAFIDGASWAFGQAAPQERAVCDHGCTAETGICIVDHKPTTASEKADREPSDAEVLAALNSYYADYMIGPNTSLRDVRPPRTVKDMRAALIAAQEVRRG